MESIAVGRNLVTYLKRSGLSKLLPHSALLEVRCDSVVDMLVSCDAFPHIKILKDKTEQRRLKGWDGELMSVLSS